MLGVSLWGHGPRFPPFRTPEPACLDVSGTLWQTREDTRAHTGRHRPRPQCTLGAAGKAGAVLAASLRSTVTRASCPRSKPGPSSAVQGAAASPPSALCGWGLGGPRGAQGPARGAAAPGQCVPRPAQARLEHGVLSVPSGAEAAAGPRHHRPRGPRAQPPRGGRRCAHWAPRPTLLWGCPAPRPQQGCGHTVLTQGTWPGGSAPLRSRPRTTSHPKPSTWGRGGGLGPGDSCVSPTLGPYQPLPAPGLGLGRS